MSTKVATVLIHLLHISSFWDGVYSVSSVFGQSDKVVDGDMIMTKEQHDMLFGRVNATGRQKRKAWGTDEKFRWTNGVIPYEFDPDGKYTDDQKRDIRKAMDVFEKETCIRFIPATDAHENKIVFIDGGSCQAALGMVGGRQTVMLSTNACRFMGLYWHEIGHALGLVHEHQLPDRDNYIQIEWRNVKEDMRRWFAKYGADTVNRFGVPYDLSSVMHYEINSFNGDTQGQTIKVLDRNKEDHIGFVFIKELSFTDVKVLNKMYKCGARCPRVRCPSEGFVDKNCRCVTPQSYRDSHCENEGDETECLEIARSGKCQRNYNNIRKCRKACDECPKFGISFPNKQGSCINRYYDDRQCQAWAREGSCTAWPYQGWMKTHCTKACNQCENFGKCANLLFNDPLCDLQTNSDNKFCKNNNANVWTSCADFCDTCGYAPKSIACSNDRGDAECDERAKRGECDSPATAVWMKTNCASSCHSCGFNKGRCSNKYDDATCERRAALDGACYQDIEDMHTNCGKTCNTCDFQFEGNCEDFESDSTCAFYKKDGMCSTNPGLTKLFCQKTCNSCGYPNGRCQDLKAKAVCEKWKGWGHCERNPEFVKYNCPVTCNSCNIITLNDYCVDVQTQAYCDSEKVAGRCNKGKANIMCRKTCNLCGKPLEKRPDDGSSDDECRDHSRQCLTDVIEFGYCSNPDLIEEMKRACPLTCGHCVPKSK